MTYDRIIRYILETPWAIRPAALGAIIEVVQFRAAGGRYSDEELMERLDATRQAEAARRGPRRAGSVAVVPLYGSIFPRANLFTDMSGGTSLQRFTQTLRELDADPKIASVVIDVASPGGVVDLVPETAELIRGMRTPVTAVADAEAASAAYWLASQADEMVVTPSGMVGSIGVWTAHEDWSRYEGNLGVETTLIAAGKYKVEANPFEPLGDEARQAIQAMVDEYYDMFVADVARGRNQSPAAVRAGFGEGRMVTAREAVRIGMADRVATLDQVIAEHAAGDVPTPRSATSDPANPIATTTVTLYVTVAEPTVEEGPAEEATLVAGAERLLARPEIREAFAPR
jgi:signal peptide peptidase SppA